MNAMNGSTPRRGIQQVGEHTYTLGKIMQRQVSTVEREGAWHPSWTNSNIHKIFSTMERHITLLPISRGRVSEIIKYAISTMMVANLDRFSFVH